MLGRFKKQEFIWEPISEWGRKMKADRERMNIVTVILNPKPKVGPAERPKRIRVRKPKARTGKPVGHPKGVVFISDRKCSMCDTCIRTDNAKGLCQKHSKQMWNLSMKGKRGKKAA
jgi:hypothetical protein